MNKRVYDITVFAGWSMITGGLCFYDWRIAAIVGGALAIGLSLFAAVYKL